MWHILVAVKKWINYKCSMFSSGGSCSGKRSSGAVLGMRGHDSVAHGVLSGVYVSYGASVYPWELAFQQGVSPGDGDGCGS